MVDLVYYLTNILSFNIPLFYYYTNLRSSIILCFTTGDIYHSLGISLSCSFVIGCELFCGELLQTFAILLAILLSIKSPVDSAVFWITLFWRSFKCIACVADCLSLSRSFWLDLPLILLLHSLLQIFNL